MPDAPAPLGPPDEFRARIVANPGLSADQQQAIDDLRAKRRTELQALDDSKDLAPDVRRDKAHAIVENYRTLMRAVLTPEQQQKADQWKQRFHRGPEDDHPPFSGLVVGASLLAMLGTESRASSLPQFFSDCIVPAMAVCLLRGAPRTHPGGGIFIFGQPAPAGARCPAMDKRQDNARASRKASPERGFRRNRP